MPITDVIYDQGANGTAEGGAVFNVKAYGAVGTAASGVNDTAAFKAAIAAASLRDLTAGQTATGGRGSVVFVPQGVYRITETLYLPSGVGIRGAGMRTSQIRFQLSKSADGLVWNQYYGDEPVTSPPQFRVGGFMEDIDVSTANRDQEGSSARDLVVIDHVQSFAFNRVRIRAAWQNNLVLKNCVDTTAVHLSSHAAGTSCLYIDADSQEGATTSRWVSCYFQDTLNGPTVDVDGIGHTFDGCVFENAGITDAAPDGYGARVRWGTAVFVGPYFEANRQFDLIVGTDATANPNVGAQQTAVTVINPTLVYNSAKKVTGAGGVKFLRGTATIIGGNYGTTPRPLVLSNSMDHVFVAAKMYGNEPEVESGSLANVPGTVLYREVASGNWIQTGAARYSMPAATISGAATVGTLSVGGAASVGPLTIGGGAPISRHLSVTAAWTPGSVANGATATYNVLVPGAQLGDTVVVSFNHAGSGLGARVLLFGSVGAVGNVAVTLLNHYGSTLNLGAGTLRVDVWQH